MTEEKKPEVVPPGDAPLWKDRGHAELRVPRCGEMPDLKHYVWLHMFRMEGGFQEATVEVKAATTAYVNAIAKKMFDCPAISQSTAYRQVSGYTPRADSNMPQYYALFRFDAFDYEQVKTMIMAEWEKVSAEVPLPSGVTADKQLFWVENHRQERHEPFEWQFHMTSTPNQKKYVAMGISRPSWDPDDPKMQVNYIDWYQEVRQHDVLRGYSGYHSSHQWLLMPGEDYAAYVFSMYEYATDDLKAYGLA